jgi:protease-4
VLKDVEKDSSVRALVVEIDTPGGSATASDEMYHRLDRFKNNKHVPVVIAMRGMATSGGYYVASAGDYIFAEPGCLTGNIGVLFPRFNLSKMANEWGVYESTLTATTPGHSYKNAGSMFQPANPQDEQYLQGLVDGTFAQFKSVVLTGRKGKLSDKEGDVFSGKAFIATDALARGLIDQIGYPDSAYDYATHLAGISSRSIVRYTPNPTLLQLLSARSNLPQGQAKASAGSVSIDGFSIDGHTAADLLSARPLLLWRGN